jgi:hypothetical protein
LGSFYVWPYVARGWISHDEGVIAHSAERVLNGEIPHVDFDELYTGGQSQLHALAFRTGGVRLITLRYCLFVFVVPFLAALYFIARRFASPAIAALLAFVGLVWSLPNYFASVPTWYVLFFATFALMCLLRSHEQNRSFWLVAAGAFAACACLVKIVGVYIVAATFLELAARDLPRAADESRGAGTFRLLKVVAVLALIATTITLIRARLSAMDIIQLVLPVAAVGAFVISDAGRGRNGFRHQMAGLLVLIFPFAVGFLAPILLFMLPYFRGRGLADLYEGVIVLPQRRLELGTFSFPPWPVILAAIPYGVFLAASLVPTRVVSAWRRIAALIVGYLTLTILLLESWKPEVYRGIWESARLIPPFVAVTGCAGLWLARRHGEDRVSGSAFPLLAFTALLGLVQFPFSAPVYFCFVAPLVVLSAGAVVRLAQPWARPLHLGVAIFYLVFAVIRMNPGYVWNLGNHPVRYRATAWLDLPRAGLKVPAEDANVYVGAVRILRTHSVSQTVFAAPDCPELYFLSELRNPTRVIVDYLARDPLGREATVSMLARNEVRAVAINEHPSYSRPLDDALRSDLARLFPHGRKLGGFELRWSETRSLEKRP